VYFLSNKEESERLIDKILILHGSGLCIVFPTSFRRRWAKKMLAVESWILVIKDNDKNK
jgi:hypothetical protein